MQPIVQFVGMSPMENNWIIALIGLVAGLTGSAIARDRHIFRQINEGDAKLAKDIIDHAEKLHDRVNRTRDECVRRDELESFRKDMHHHFDRLVAALDRQDQRIEKLISSVSLK